MTGSGGNTSTACAACKYQRRKCTEDCPLSPYFPADQPKRFQNVHKLFGVSNILRILKHVDPSKREDTIKSITYEADTREKDPVHGCLGVITILQNQVSKLKDELTVASDQLYLLQAQQQHTFNHQVGINITVDAQMQQQQIVGSTLGGSTSVVNVISAAQETPLSVLMQQQQYNDITQHLAAGGSSSAGFPKSSFALSLPTSSSFEPDQYLRSTDSFNDIKMASTTTRFDVARYIRGNSSPVLQQRQLGSAAAKEQEEQFDGHRHHPGGSAASRAFTGGYHTEDVDHANFGEFTLDDRTYATAIRRRGSSTSAGDAGRLMNLTVASDSELRRRASSSGGGGGHHELRSAGVYLTLTNN